MESIDPEHLYDERGEVSRSRPIFQADLVDGTHYAAHFIDVTALYAHSQTEALKAAGVSLDRVVTTS
jgi:hypothetical protein